MNKKKRTHSKSIVKQVHHLNMFFVFGWILILCIVLAQFVYFYNDILSSNAQESIEKYAVDMEHEFDKLEKNIYTLMGEKGLENDITLAKSEDFLEKYNASERVRERLVDFYTQYSYIADFSVYTEKDVRISGSEMLDFIPEGIQKNMFEYYMDKSEKRYAFLGARILNRRGEDIGRLILKLNVAKMYDIKHSKMDAEFIISENGEMVGYNIPQELDLRSYIPKEGIKYKNDKINGNSVFVIFLADNENKFTYGRIIESKFVMEELGQILPIVGVIILLLMVYIIFFSCRHIESITKPIREMKDDLEELEQNNYTISEYNNIIGNTDNEIYLFRKQMYSVIKRMNSYVKKNYIVECELKEARLKQLHAQINPHFLYNTLNILYWRATEKGQDDIAVMIKNMGELFRYSIDTTSDTIPLGKEIKMMSDYVEIHKMRFKERLTVIMDIDKECTEILIPRFSIQPLLENSIIATVQNKVGNYTVKVCVKKLDDKLEVCVLDEGEGISQEILGKIKDGTYNKENNISALYNIDRRIKYLYGKEYGIFAQRRENMAAVGFIIPI